jgi:hypothetical protein
VLSITATTAVVNGVISCDGLDGAATATTTSSGGGSGGSILLLLTSTLTGTGSISAKVMHTAQSYSVPKCYLPLCWCLEALSLGAQHRLPLCAHLH